MKPSHFQHLLGFSVRRSLSSQMSESSFLDVVMTSWLSSSSTTVSGSTSTLTLLFSVTRVTSLLEDVHCFRLSGCVLSQARSFSTDERVAVSICVG
uniref:Uncharacterized protein n=1 Tax=Arcella intermedia TaxID=1963864 RepID=A0A6B2LDU4_9EUKA